MSTPPIGYADLIQIVELLRASSQFSEFKLKSGEFELEVRRGPAASEAGAGAAPAATAVATGSAGMAAAPALPAAPAAPAVSATPATPAPPARPAAAARYSERAWRLTAPMLGTFYCAPEPGAAPFVRPGQPVRAGDTVCIIEVMKLMNTLAAGEDGVVVDVLVEDGQAVEYGQLLMVIEPH